MHVATCAILALSHGLHILAHIPNHFMELEPLPATPQTFENIDS